MVLADLPGANNPNSAAYDPVRNTWRALPELPLEAIQARGHGRLRDIEPARRARQALELCHREEGRQLRLVHGEQIRILRIKSQF